MDSFKKKKRVLFLVVLVGLFVYLVTWVYSLFGNKSNLNKSSIFEKTAKCVTELLDQGNVLECGLVRQTKNRIVVVGKIDKLIINEDQEIFAEISLVNTKKEEKKFLFLLNSGGVVPITIHQGRDISNWNGNDNQYLRFTSDEFSLIQEKLVVGRSVYLLLSTDCNRKYCNNNRILLDWLNGNEVNFDIVEGECYLNSIQIEYSLAD